MHEEELYRLKDISKKEYFLMKSICLHMLFSKSDVQKFDMNIQVRSFNMYIKVLPHICWLRFFSCNRKITGVFLIK